jgi:hypothetical protein
MLDCKVKCVTKQLDNGSYYLYFDVVNSGSKDNIEFFKNVSAPREFKISKVNEAIAANFEVEKEYIFYLRPA